MASAALSAMLSSSSRSACENSRPERLLTASMAPMALPCRTMGTHISDRVIKPVWASAPRKMRSSFCASAMMMGSRRSTDVPTMPAPMGTDTFLMASASGPVA